MGKRRRKKSRKVKKDHVVAKNQNQGDESVHATDASARSGVTIYKPAPQCHIGPRFVFQLGQTGVWGGRGVDIRRHGDWGLIIPCVERSWSTLAMDPYISANDVARQSLPPELFNIPEEMPYLAIDWPDMETPLMNRQWWETLASHIEGMGETDVAFYCQGGHGRTGTALATLAAVSGQVPHNECPVAWLRERYCTKAVETSEQARYIEHTSGHIVTTEVNDWMYGYASDNPPGGSAGFGTGHTPGFLADESESIVEPVDPNPNQDWEPSRPPGSQIWDDEENWEQ